MIVAILLRLYKLVLHIFPRAFRAEFEDEMVDVFRESVQEQAAAGSRHASAVFLRELRQLPPALWRVHRAALQKKYGVRMRRYVYQSPFHEIIPADDGRFSRHQAIKETIPLLLTALFLIYTVYINPTLTFSGQRLPWFGMGWSALPALLLLLWGLVCGLPRWAYPPAGILLGYSFLPAQQYELSFFWMSVVVAMVGLGLTAVYTHIFHQPLPPFLQQIGTSMSIDWTRLVFGLYGMTPSFIILSFDDVYRNNQTPYFALALLMMVIGAWFYSRSRSQRQQFGLLTMSFSLAFVPALLEQAAFHANWLTTPQAWLADLRWLSPLWALMITLMLLPLIGSMIYRVWAAGHSTAPAKE